MCPAVENFIPKVVISKPTLEPIQGKNLIYANGQIVAENLPDPMNYRDIKEFTRVKNLLNVNIARNHFPEQTI